jgi:hypothetical protein
LAGHIQIAESWAEHMALTIVKNMYPATVSSTSNLASSWELHHEIVRNEPINHISIGIYFDLIDGVTTGESTRNENGTANRTLSGPVGGAFNNFELARILNSTIKTPADLRAKCLQDRPVFVSDANINMLFSEY